MKMNIKTSEQIKNQRGEELRTWIAVDDFITILDELQRGIYNRVKMGVSLPNTVTSAEIGKIIRELKQLEDEE